MASVLEAPARLGIRSLETPLTERLLASVRSNPKLPGDLASARDWHDTAAMLDDVGGIIQRRFLFGSPFDRALARFIAREVRGSAAEIRANIALEELYRCKMEL